MSGSARLRADQKLKGGGNYDSSGAIQKGKFTEKLATSPLWSHLHRLRCFLDSMMRTACLRDMMPVIAHSFHTYALYLLNNFYLTNQDWDNRDFVETIQLNVLKLTDFLNEFDRATKQKLARVNGKMSKLERTIEFCEAAVQASLQPAQSG